MQSVKDVTGDLLKVKTYNVLNLKAGVKYEGWVMRWRRKAGGVLEVAGDWRVHCVTRCSHKDRSTNMLLVLKEAVMSALGRPRAIASPWWLNVCRPDTPTVYWTYSTVTKAALMRVVSLVPLCSASPPSWLLCDSEPSLFTWDTNVLKHDGRPSVRWPHSSSGSRL